MLIKFRLLQRDYDSWKPGPLRTKKLTLKLVPIILDLLGAGLIYGNTVKAGY